LSLDDEFEHWAARVIEVPREHSVRLRCPVRGREFVDGPEERIRQGLLHYLLEVALEVDFKLGAERERHDIDLRWPGLPNFPAPTPLLIVETKVDHVAGDWTNTQLARYLAETGGELGVVFTGRRMWRLTLAPSGMRSVPLASLADLAALIRDRVAIDPLSAARGDFNAACAGDVDALRRLVERYRYATFVLVLRGVEVACRGLRFGPQGIAYRSAGQHTLRPSTIATGEFERLVRIEP